MKTITQKQHQKRTQNNAAHFDEKYKEPATAGSFVTDYDGLLQRIDLKTDNGQVNKQ
ncbi:hypothetical protein GCM10011350_30570 [Marinomonas arctica]|nr:hypothetical protein GCM10011350_30570 [Marinomonas arctica]